MITVSDPGRGSTSDLRSHTFLFSAQRATVDLLTRLTDRIVPSGRFFGPGGLSQSIRANDQSGTYESLNTATGLCCWAMTHAQRRRHDEQRRNARVGPGTVNKDAPAQRVEHATCSGPAPAARGATGGTVVVGSEFGPWAWTDGRAKRLPSQGRPPRSYGWLVGWLHAVGGPIYVCRTQP